MRASAASGVLLLTLCFTELAFSVSSENDVVSRDARLEIPSINEVIESNSSGAIPDIDIDALRVVIPHQPDQINYGSIATKVNTESANVIMQVRSNTDGIICDLDLSRRGGFRLHPGRNSVEIAFYDGRHRLMYSSFILEAPQPAPAPQAPANSSPDSSQGEMFAVVVGISKYQHSGPAFPDPRFADRDAHDFYDYLVSAQGGGLRAQNVKLLLNADAERESLRTSLTTFLGRAGASDTVVLFFAGHGAADVADEGPLAGKSNLYLFTSDSDPGDIRGTAFGLAELQQFLEDSVRARHVILIADACRILGIGGSESGSSVRQNNLINQYLDKFAATGNRAVITAGDINQISQESERWDGGHGVFAYYLLRGIRGDADLNSDGIVTLGELFAYVRDHVYKETAGAQRPIARPGYTASLPLKRGLSSKSDYSARVVEPRGGPTSETEPHGATAKLSR